MKLFALVCLTMVAFAANSVLNRAAVGPGGMGAMDFAVLRLWAGSAALCGLALLLGRPVAWRGPGRMTAIAGLAAYLVGFSWAYLSLDAGLGALILFGTVQITMFAGSIAGGERPPPRRWAGAAVALAGLAWLFWPTDVPTFSPMHGLAMCAAGIGWGAYSLAGRLGGDPLAGTAANFALAAPLGLVLLAVPGTLDPSSWTGAGMVLALASGAVASGLGYALWYALLPRLQGTTAAVAQLSVPILAAAGGIAFLSEPLEPRLVVAGIAVLGGVALSVLPPRRG
jgi:drug/metabolite transporter (DMT)-like permease